MANIIDKLASRARVRVYKPTPGSDDRKKLEGQPIQVGFDEAGNPAHFFEIPVHRADYINRAFSKYRVSEPFIPGVDEAPAGILDKEFACDFPGCGKTFTTAQALNGHRGSHAK